MPGLRSRSFAGSSDVWVDPRCSSPHDGVKGSFSRMRTVPQCEWSTRLLQLSSEVQGVGDPKHLESALHGSHLVRQYGVVVRAKRQ